MPVAKTVIRKLAGCTPGPWIVKGTCAPRAKVKKSKRARNLGRIHKLYCSEDLKQWRNRCYKRAMKPSGITRRDFLVRSGIACSVAALASNGAEPTTPAPAAATGSDVGSLFPIIQSEAVKGEFPLSFLNSKFSSVKSWKRKG